MIARLKGILAEKSKERVVVDVQGVGYGLLVPETVLHALPNANEPVTLEVYTHVREDALLLFGFANRLEKDTFEILLSANGVGPKLALAILSGLPARQLLEAVVRGDKTSFAGISGVGKKTVEKLLIEIKEKCEKRLVQEKLGPDAAAVLGSTRKSSSMAAASSVPWLADLEEALRGLGYRDMELKAILGECAEKADELKGLEAALRHSLQRLQRQDGRGALRGNA